MKLALFDLDHTLLDGDSDHLWGRLLVREGALDGDEFTRANARYYAEYRAGRLDIHEFLAFGLRPLGVYPLERLERWREQLLRESILPRIPDDARRLVERHAEAGHTLVLITATNSFVTAPIADELGIPHLIATDPEFDGTRFTGRVAGVPCFREGKVARLEQWLKDRDARADESWFYTDSHNDLPLLERVAHPTAVNPDETLARIAGERGWPVREIRRTPPTPGFVAPARTSLP